MTGAAAVSRVVEEAGDEQRHQPIRLSQHGQRPGDYRVLVAPVAAPGVSCSRGGPTRVTACRHLPQRLVTVWRGGPYLRPTHRPWPAAPSVWWASRAGLASMPRVERNIWLPAAGEQPLAPGTDHQPGRLFHVAVAHHPADGLSAEPQDHHPLRSDAPLWLYGLVAVLVVR
jgi:hypothetical protein